MSMYKHTFIRHKTREVRVGTLVVGGDNPIWVQSMTTPDTHDIEATVAQIHRLEEAGCEIVRVTVPKAQEEVTRQTFQFGRAGRRDLDTVVTRLETFRRLGQLLDRPRCAARQQNR